MLPIQGPEIGSYSGARDRQRNKFLTQKQEAGSETSFQFSSQRRAAETSFLSRSKRQEAREASDPEASRSGNETNSQFRSQRQKNLIDTHF